MKWNHGQKQAIERRDGSLLVSAAAGSGKTAVLVERIIRQIVDEEQDIRNFLVVTFTRAAAAQMKEKIAKKINEALKQDPENEALKKAKFNLPFADISTIDSFCIGLVRDNFQDVSVETSDGEVGISADFGILDDTQRKTAQKTAVRNVIDRYYETRTEEIKALSNQLNTKKDNTELMNCVTKLCNKCLAYPSVDMRLEEIRSNYDCTKGFKNTFWYELLKESTIEKIDGVFDDIDEIEFSITDPVIKEKYLPVLSEDREFFENIKQTIIENDIERLFKLYENRKSRIIKITGEEVDNQEKERVGRKRNTYKGKTGGADFTQKTLEWIFESDEKHEKTIKNVSAYVNTLLDLVKDYYKEYMQIVNEANAYDYSDILHFAIDLLIDENGKKTPLAWELSKKYTEILVDEYQDVTLAQDMLFDALSNGDNRFMVGDVKQSIYLFRNAMPEVFTNLRKQMEPQNKVVILDANYRSTKTILDISNFVFSQIMSEKMGGVDYNENEELKHPSRLENYAPKGDKTDEPAELHLLRCSSEKNQYQHTAEHIANLIQNEIDAKKQVFDNDKGVYRDCEYRDFCILTRNTTNYDIYLTVFENMGIPLSATAKNKFLETPEIRLLVSLLRVIDNPVNDVDLAAVMLSPIYGFTLDELSKMRIEKEMGSFYDAVVNYSKMDEKTAQFLKNLENLRGLSVTMRADQFIINLIDDTGYRALNSVLKYPKERLENINRFVNLVKQNENNGYKGLSAFLRFLTNLDTFETENNTRGENSVTLSTIHKSKGLEYPFVYIAETEKLYNELDLSDTVSYSKEIGVAFKTIENFTKNDNFMRMLSADCIKQSNRSEEIRLLYVAMTRASEKLTMVACRSDEKDFDVVNYPVLSPVSVSKFNSYAKLLLHTLVKHPDAHSLREMDNIGLDAVLPCDSRLEIFIEQPPREEEEIREEELVEKEEVKTVDKALLKKITDRLSYEYPYKKLQKLVGKRIASDLEEKGFNSVFFATSKPGFVSDGKISGAQKGIATHRLMQHIDFERAKTDLEGELKRLVETGRLSEKEAKAVEKKSVKNFFYSPLAKRIANSNKVYREYAFTAGLPAYEIYPEVPECDELVLIEGVVDCAFEENGEIIIVDFKTDRAISAEELVEHYSKQLITYRKCLGKVLGENVNKSVIYSFALEEEIEVL